MQPRTHAPDAGNSQLCPSVTSAGIWHATCATPEPASCLGFGMRAFTLPEDCLVRNMAAMYSFSAQAGPPPPFLAIWTHRMPYRHHWITTETKGR